MTRSEFAVCLGILNLVVVAGCGQRQQIGIKANEAKQDQQVSEFVVNDAATEPPAPALLDPSLASETAPDKFRVEVETTKGDFVIEVTRDWSPNGADRFYNLVKNGFYADIAIFRAVDDFVLQFGIHGNPAVSSKWASATIKDDPRKGISNQTAAVTFAKKGRPDSRATQIFVNMGDNSSLDRQGFTPFGLVTEGFGVLEEINTEYGEVGAEVQMFMQAQGNEYVRKKLPNIDFVESIELIEE